MAGTQTHNFEKGQNKYKERRDGHKETTAETQHLYIQPKLTYLPVNVHLINNHYGKSLKNKQMKYFTDFSPALVRVLHLLSCRLNGRYNALFILLDSLTEVCQHMKRLILQVTYEAWLEPVCFLVNWIALIWSSFLSRGHFGTLIAHPASVLGWMPLGCVQKATVIVNHLDYSGGLKVICPGCRRFRKAATVCQSLGLKLPGISQATIKTQNWQTDLLAESKLKL